MESLIEEALLFATACHSGQKRKLTGIPYILHPAEVATIISTITTDEEVIAAGLLHDVVEDTGVTMDKVREKFGERVATIVAGETENKRSNLPAESTWKIRKEESLEELKNAQDEGIKILWLADKVANMRSLYHAYLNEGDDVFLHFHQKDKKEQEWYYRTIAEYTSQYQNTAAYKEYVNLVKKVFE